MSNPAVEKRIPGRCLFVCVGVKFVASKLSEMLNILEVAETLLVECPPVHGPGPGQEVTVRGTSRRRGQLSRSIRH